MTGSGIKNGVAERPVSLSIVAKDKHGAPRSDGGDDFHVVFEVDNERIDVPVVDNGISLFFTKYLQKILCYFKEMVLTVQNLFPPKPVKERC